MASYKIQLIDVVNLTLIFFYKTLKTSNFHY
jgi:hypothetical protein